MKNIYTIYIICQACQAPKSDRPLPPPLESLAPHIDVIVMVVQKHPCFILLVCVPPRPINYHLPHFEMGCSQFVMISWAV